MYANKNQFKGDKLAAMTKTKKQQFDKVTRSPQRRRTSACERNKDKSCEERCDNVTRNQTFAKRCCEVKIAISEKNREDRPDVHRLLLRLLLFVVVQFVSNVLRGDHACADVAKDHH